MKSIKVFYMGKPLREVYPHATRFQVLKWKVKEGLKWCVRWLFKIGMIGGTGYAIFIAGQFSASVTTYAAPNIVTAQSPVLDRIKSCESKNNQLGGNGQTLVHINKNNTVDVGAYQINLTVWGEKATQLGYNLFTEDGNKKMAEWIYLNKGTGDWSSSASCWQK